MKNTIEHLESRRLLSVSLSESEPNNTRSRADDLPRIIEQTLEVRGTVATTADHDWFKINLRAGDVLGVAVTGALPDTGGLDPFARLVDSSGKLVIANTGPAFNAGDELPPESPLPRADRSRLGVEFYRVIAKAGTYFLDVSSFDGTTAGRYDLELRVARPAMESAPRGTKQILFLDFDGARVNLSDYGGSSVPFAGYGNTRIQPLADSIPEWGLAPDEQLDDVIHAIVAYVRRKLVGDIAADGLNDDFGLVIRNSFDHADPGNGAGGRYVSRIAIGDLDIAEVIDAGFGGGAEWIDVGNFNTHDKAVAFTDFVADVVVGSAIEPPLTVFDAAVVGIGNVIVHEAGHIFGNFHTEQPPDLFGGTPNIMDPAGVEVLGPDFVFGTADDNDLRFGTDDYSLDELFTGVNDTLNTIAFGLSTGKGVTSTAVATASQSRLNLSNRISLFDAIEQPKEELL